MPELPEILAHAERLDNDFAGATLARLEILSFTVLKTYKPFPDDLHGRALDSVGHRGKHLLFRFGTLTQVVHLMQGGRLKPDLKQSKKPRGGLARWYFDDGRALLLTEAGSERKAGIWVVEGDPDISEPLVDLGPDADLLTRDQLAERLADDAGRLHGWLRRQSHLAGIGRMLANEVCHRAKISPFARSTSLTDEQVDALHEAIGAALVAALDFERSLGEMSYSKDRPSLVHHRKGDACATCDEAIRSVEYNRYTVFYCANCQTGGKVLADNTTSKFLK